MTTSAHRGQVAGSGQKDAAWVARMGRHGVQVLAVVLVLALVFTMVNVQQFAAQGQPAFGVQWWIAWLLDPMASVSMAAAIVFEGLLADYGKPEVRWLTATKWYAGICTWVMNVWTSAVAHDLGGILLHSVAPGILLGLAEAAPRVRRLMAEIIADLEGEAEPVTVHDDPEPGPVPVPTWEPVVTSPSWVAPTGSPSWAVSVAPAAPAAPVVPGPEPELDPLELVEPVTVANGAGAGHPPPDPVLVQVIGWPADDPAAGRLTDDELDARIHQMLSDAVAAGARPPGRRVISEVLGSRATPYRVRMSLQRVGEPTRVLSLNGAGSGAGHQSVSGRGGDR